MDKLTQIEGGTEANQIVTAAADWVQTWLPYGLNLFSAIAIAIGGFLLAGLASRFLRKRMSKLEHVDKTLIPVMAQVVRYSILLFVVILVMAEFGIQTTSIIAVLGAAGLAIGLALQGTLQNVAAGIMLLMIRPFQVGDFIEAGGASGTVDEIGLFMTRMHTPQGIFVAVPNSKLWSGTITNFSLRPERRLDLIFGISYNDDIDKAIGVLHNLIEKDERVLDYPEPVVIVKNLGESSVDLEIRAWTRRHSYWDLRFDTIRAAKYAFDKAGISIPYPHREIITQQETTTTRSSKPRKKTPSVKGQKAA